jgi:hypothetical protein
MLRRAKDNLIPELKDMDKPKKAEPSPIRKGVTPHQNKLSVQDVRDYSTPAGASMANEEMRRLRLYVNEVSDKVDTKAAGSPTSNTPTKIITTPEMDSKPDSFGAVDNGLLSVKHNNIVVGEPQNIEALNYIDYNIGDYRKEYIGFDLDASTLEQTLTSDLVINNKRQINIKAFVKRQVLTGYIDVNNLPLSSNSYLATDEWKTENRYYTPAEGYAGWYVYAIIDHGWKLNNRNDYIIQFYDTHEVTLDDFTDEVDLDDVAEYLQDLIDRRMINPLNEQELRDYVNFYYQNIYAPAHGLYQQEYILEHEGLDVKVLTSDGITLNKQIIRLHAIYKPDQFPYFGREYTQAVEYIDVDKIRTNLRFYYRVIKI